MQIGFNCLLSQIEIILLMLPLTYKALADINFAFESAVRGSLPLINPEPEGQGVYQWQTSDDQGQGQVICLWSTP